MKINMPPLWLPFWDRITNALNGYLRRRGILPPSKDLEFDAVAGFTEMYVSESLTVDPVLLEEVQEGLSLMSSYLGAVPIERILEALEEFSTDDRRKFKETEAAMSEVP